MQSEQFPGNARQAAAEYQALRAERYDQLLETGNARLRVEYQGEYFYIDMCATGEAELTAEMIACLTQKYDFERMSPRDWASFYADLSQLGLIPGANALNSATGFMVAAGDRLAARPETSARSLADLLKIMLAKSQDAAAEQVKNLAADLDTQRLIQDNRNYYMKMTELLRRLVVA